MAIPLRVLILEDSSIDAELEIRELRRAGFDPQWKRAETEEEYLCHLDESIDIILSDYRLPLFDPKQALRILNQRGLKIPFIIVSGAIGEEMAVSLIREGATDYLLKDRLARLGPAVSQVLQKKQAELRNIAFSSLGHRLSAAFKPEEAAKIIIEVADQLFGWDACTLDLYSPEQNTVYPLVNVDTIDGKRKDVTPVYVHLPPTPRMQEVIEKGRQLILRDGSSNIPENSIPYGDVSRLSASIMIVPIRNISKVIGILSIQSYSSKAYDEGDLEALQGLGDYCGGALERMRTEESLRRAKLRTMAFSNLGQQLNSATRPEEAARIIVDVAEELFGWDSCYLHLYSARDKQTRNLLNIDLIDGKKTVLPSTLEGRPSPRMLQVIQKGAHLILRENTDTFLPDAIPFGLDKPSASIMTVPVRNTAEVIGVLSIQSYTLKAYNQQDLETLQSLADYCSGALERIRAEEKLSYQANLLANVNDAIIATDAEFVLTSWNHAAEEMYGWKAEEAIGRKLHEVIPMDWAEERKEFDHLLATTGRSRIELKHYGRDGQPIFVEGTTIALKDEKGQITGYASVNRNVSKRRQLEEQLRQSQKMEAVGQLAGGVAHDFNNILTVITGYTNLILAEEGLTQEMREELGLVSASAEKASNLTRQLLTLSRKKEMQLTAVQLNEVVNSLTKMLQRLIGENVKLQLKCASALPELRADASMIEQVLLNLAINARDAMPKGGDLFISTEAVKIDESYTHAEARRGECVCLVVRDTGCGMPPDIQARIFEPFFTTKGPGQGTGLGLATVYGIVKQHQGWIEVISQLGLGTTFKVFLPVTASATEAKERLRPTESRGGSETILLVEDEAGVRGLVRQVLQRQGYRILEAESGVKALAIWEKHQQDIDLLVTDMVMPGGIDGRDLAVQLESHKPDLKVIYTSGYSVNLSELELRDGWNFLQKPYQPKQLVQTIRRRLDDK